MFYFYFLSSSCHTKLRLISQLWKER